MKELLHRFYCHFQRCFTPKLSISSYIVLIRRVKLQLHIANKIHNVDELECRSEQIKFIFIIYLHNWGPHGVCYK